MRLLSTFRSLRVTRGQKRNSTQSWDKSRVSTITFERVLGLTTLENLRQLNLHLLNPLMLNFFLSKDQIDSGVTSVELLFFLKMKQKLNHLDLFLSLLSNLKRIQMISTCPSPKSCCQMQLCFSKWNIWRLVTKNTLLKKRELLKSSWINFRSFQNVS